MRVKRRRKWLGEKLKAYHSFIDVPLIIPNILKGQLLKEFIHIQEERSPSLHSIHKMVSANWEFRINNIYVLGFTNRSPFYLIDSKA
jgi:hypothetical protein